jgi:Phage protein Gp138 N-terminal domain
MIQTADPGSVGYSQQGPNEFSTEYSKARFLVQQMQAALETMMPVQVITFHAGEGTPPGPGTVDVQLLVSQIDGAGHVMPHGIVYGLPCYRSQGGKWAIISDAAANDFGYIIVGARDISVVKANPGIQQPGSRRTHSYSDAVYMGGFLNDVPVAWIWLRPDGTLKISDANGNVLDTSSGSWVITGNVEVIGTLTATKLETGEDGLAVTGTITATGDVIANLGASQVSLTNHLTSAVQTGADESGPPVPGT